MVPSTIPPVPMTLRCCSIPRARPRAQDRPALAAQPRARPATSRHAAAHRDDRCLNVMPLFHIHGLMAAVLASLDAGATVVCTPGLHASGFFDWIEECRPPGTPPCRRCISDPRPRRARRTVIKTRPAALHALVLGSLPPPVMADSRQTFGAPVIEAYGMTEAAHQMACNPCRRRRASPDRSAAAGPRVAIMDDAARCSRRARRARS